MICACVGVALDVIVRREMPVCVCGVMWCVYVCPVCHR